MQVVDNKTENNKCSLEIWFISLKSYNWGKTHYLETRLITRIRICNLSKQRSYLLKVRKVILLKEVCSRILQSWPSSCLALARRGQIACLPPHALFFSLAPSQTSLCWPLLISPSPSLILSIFTFLMGSYEVRASSLSYFPAQSWCLF